MIFNNPGSYTSLMVVINRNHYLSSIRWRKP